MRRSLFFVSLIPLCVGQMCGSPAPVENPGTQDEVTTPGPITGSDGSQTQDPTVPQATFTVEVAIVGEGQVSMDPPGGTYNQGTMVTLTAVPATGWRFDSWSGSASGSDPVISGTGRSFIVALFLPNPPEFPPQNPQPPGSSTTPLEIDEIYGDEVLLLSDDSVWEAWTYFFGWDTGDEVVVNGSTLTNLSENNDTEFADYLGQAVADTRVNQILESGCYVKLLNGTKWEIGVLDRIKTTLWLPIQGVIVVQKSVGGVNVFHLVNTSKGDAVDASLVAN
ncbi:MAG: hypothetical protein HRF43_07075 [Phycisphaerae bacterium]|jgi:hypothetical protein